MQDCKEILAALAVYIREVGKNYWTKKRGTADVTLMNTLADSIVGSKQYN